MNTLHVYSSLKSGDNVELFFKVALYYNITTYLAVTFTSLTQYISILLTFMPIIFPACLYRLHKKKQGSETADYSKSEASDDSDDLIDKMIDDKSLDEDRLEHLMKQVMCSLF